VLLVLFMAVDNISCCQYYLV